MTDGFQNSLKLLQQHLKVANVLSEAPEHPTKGLRKSLVVVDITSQNGLLEGSLKTT